VSKLGKAAGVFGFILICSALPAAPLERSISPSRQFIIFGGNRILRSAVSDAAERVKSKLLALLQSRDRVGETHGLDRFHEVVDGAVLECLHRIAVVGRDEHEVRAPTDEARRLDAG